MSSGFRVPVQVAETDVGAIPANLATGQVGWIAGSPASLAANAFIDCWFDLGSNWSQYVKVAVGVISTAPATQYQAVQVSSSDVYNVYNVARRLNFENNSIVGALGSIGTTVATGPGAQTLVRPMGRYLMVRLQSDATNAQGATSKVTIAAYPA